MNIYINLSILLSLGSNDIKRATFIKGSRLLIVAMRKTKEQVIQLIEQKARRNVAALAGQYARARPEEREDIQAGIEIERWLAETCQECMDHSPKC